MVDAEIGDHPVGRLSAGEGEEFTHLDCTIFCYSAFLLLKTNLCDQDWNNLNDRNAITSLFLKPLEVFCSNWAWEGLWALSWSWSTTPTAPTTTASSSQYNFIIRLGDFFKPKIQWEISKNGREKWKGSLKGSITRAAKTNSFSRDFDTDSLTSLLQVHCTIMVFGNQHRPNFHRHQSKSSSPPCPMSIDIKQHNCLLPLQHLHHQHHHQHHHYHQVHWQRVIKEGYWPPAAVGGNCPTVSEFPAEGSIDPHRSLLFMAAQYIPHWGNELPSFLVWQHIYHV